MIGFMEFAGREAYRSTGLAFYRDEVGLPEVGRFVDHNGYHGVFLPAINVGHPAGRQRPHPTRAFQGSPYAAAVSAAIVKAVRREPL